MLPTREDSTTIPKWNLNSSYDIMGDRNQWIDPKHLKNALISTLGF